MALASLLGEGARRPPRRGRPPNPLAPEPAHFPPKAKSVIYLFMAGGPSQLELFDHKPELQKYHGQPIPESFIKGQAVRLHGHVHQGAAQAAGHAAQVRPARRVGRVGLGVPAAPRRGGRRPRVRPLGGDRRLQPRPGEALRQHRLAAVRPAEHGVVGHLRHRQRVARPARLRRPPVRPARAARRRGQLGAAASCRRPTRASRSAPAASRSSTWPARRASTPRPPARAHRRDPRPEPRPARRDRRPRDRHPDRRLRDGLPDADQRPGADRPVAARRRRRSTLYGAEPGKPSFANNCLLARRLVERGVRFVQLYHTDWDHHGGPGQTSTSDLDTVCREIDQPVRGPDHAT